MNRMTMATTLAATVFLVACSSPAMETTPPPPPAIQHLYVGDDAATGSLRSYALPLTATSTPVASVPMNKAFLIGLNSTTLAVTDLSSNLYWFTLPLTSSSVAYATTTAASDGTPVFTASGDLYQGGSGRINVYAAPFTNSATPVSTILTPGLSPATLARDPSNTFYEASGANSIGVVSNGALTTTMTAAAGMQFRGLAATATQLFACGFVGSSNNVYIYPLPLTATAVPATTINLGTAGPEGCAVDSNGNLYVGAIGGQILVFTPPFTSASVPSLTLTTPAIIFGIAIGN